MTIDLPFAAEDANEILEAVITNEQVKHPQLTFSAGSKTGEGYMAINTAVDVKGDNKSLNLFIKAAPKHRKLREISSTHILYTNELYFYQVIYPKLEEFYREKTGKLLDFAPKFYAGNGEEMKEMLVMGNLKSDGFALNGVRNIFSKEQVVLVMNRYGEFHGTSFSLKDQKQQIFKEISNDLPDFFYLLFKSMGMNGLVKYRCQLMEKYLESPEDAVVLEKIKFLIEDVETFFGRVRDFKGDYRTILHGDCWSNNMLFRNDKDNLELRLLDFQAVRLNSPALDLCYFFYASASSEENLSQLDFFLDVYHQSLSATIRKLGSDPEKLYPKSVLMEDWKTFAIFGLIMAFMVKVYEVDETESAPNIVDFVEGPVPADYIDQLTDKNRGEYMNRMKLLVRHFIVKGFI